jgi:hypothetical protein
VLNWDHEEYPVITAAFGDGHVVTVDDAGNVLDASTPAARSIVEGHMSRSVVRQTFRDGKEYVEDLEPGMPGHVWAVMERLPMATLTPERPPA